MLIDPFGRRITYLRLSVTDRCDLRCVYCMSEDMTFLPRSQVLSAEEIERLVRVFVRLGVHKVRLTGGEPLTRKDIVDICGRLSALPGLEHLVLSTNATQLDRLAAPLKAAGVKRLNISLDSLDPERFREVTRRGDVHQVLAGIEAAREARLPVRLNAVILRGHNDDEVEDLAEYVIARGMNLAFIEEMPLGDTGHSRAHTSVPNTELLARLQARHHLVPTTETTGGPARYYRVTGTDSRIGFVSPHTHNFCGDCNRVRVTSEGRLLLCLGHEAGMELRPLLRDPAYSDDDIEAAIRDALTRKPEKHEFELKDDWKVVRFMNMTGG